MFSELPEMPFLSYKVLQAAFAGIIKTFIISISLQNTESEFAFQKYSYEVC